MTAEPTPNPNAARFERTYDAPAELIRGRARRQSKASPDGHLPLSKATRRVK
jgi:hypothetical protein